jgi:hypothetical protein
MVGLERFELSSIAPEATSLDQASRQPRAVGLLTLCSFVGHQNKHSSRLFMVWVNQNFRLHKMEEKMDGGKRHRSSLSYF